jgi:hypothetical protein
MSLQQREHPLEKTPADATPNVRYRKVPRAHIYKSLLSAAFFGAVLSGMVIFRLNRPSYDLLSIYLLVFALPAVFAFLLGWISQYRRLAFLVGTLLGFTFFLVNVFAFGFSSLFIYLLPITIGGAFFATLGASMRSRIEYPRQKH